MSTPHHVVTRLHVTGGFLAGAELEFVDGLNCLIGGRGAGKTTALEFLRFGLGLMPDPKVHGQRHKTIDGLVKGNLGSGAITVALTTKDGMAYTASRRASEEVLVANELGQAVPVSVSNDVSHQRRRDDRGAASREPRRFRGGTDDRATEDHG